MSNEPKTAPSAPASTPADQTAKPGVDAKPAAVITPAPQVTPVSEPKKI